MTDACVQWFCALFDQSAIALPLVAHHFNVFIPSPRLTALLMNVHTQHEQQVRTTAGGETKESSRLKLMIDAAETKRISSQLVPDSMQLKLRNISVPDRTHTACFLSTCLHSSSPRTYSCSFLQLRARARVLLANPALLGHPPPRATARVGICFTSLDPTVSAVPPAGGLRIPSSKRSVRFSFDAKDPTTPSPGVRLSPNDANASIAH